MQVNTKYVVQDGTYSFTSKSGDNETTLRFKVVKDDGEEYWIFQDGEKYWLYWKVNRFPKDDSGRCGDEAFSSTTSELNGEEKGPATLEWYSVVPQSFDNVWIQASEERFIARCDDASHKFVGVALYSSDILEYYTPNFPASSMRTKDWALEEKQESDEGVTVASLVLVALCFGTGALGGWKIPLKLWWDLAPWLACFYLGQRTFLREPSLAVASLFFLHFCLCGLPRFLVPAPFYDKLGSSIESAQIAIFALLLAGSYHFAPRAYAAVRQSTVARMSLVWFVGIICIGFYSMDDEYNHLRLFSYYSSGLPWSIFNPLLLILLLTYYWRDYRKAPLTSKGFAKSLQRVVDALKEPDFDKTNFTKLSQRLDDLEDSFVVTQDLGLRRYSALGPDMAKSRDQLAKLTPANIAGLSPQDRRHIGEDLKVLADDLQNFHDQLVASKAERVRGWRHSPFLSTWLQT